jgi:hypothetical protein
MLTEIALTPHTFQPCTFDEKGWANQFRALNQRLIHYGNHCPLIFSNLNGGHETSEWLAVVAKKLGAIKTPNRRAAMDLFDWIKRDHLVLRPPLGKVRSAEDECHWVEEAAAPGYPIDHVVTSWQGLNVCQKVFTDAVGINELDGKVFWQDITVSASPPPNISSQVDALRPIWLHGQFLAVVLPYGLGNEADWFFAFAKRALGRPGGHGVPSIEFHVSFDRNREEMTSQGEDHSAIRSFLQRARQALPKGSEITLYARAKMENKQQFIARRLFAGKWSDVGTGVPKESIRWGVSLEHVAQPGEPRDQAPPTFTLLPRQQADSQFRFECRNTSPRLLGPITIKC